ncbi:hypothetical protein [Alteribacter aurantiacus]|uniref:hypothetical protein n=1 Tax=Alteribacter aurantiacus TaxID=254410 RepID=UPI000423CD11|nr:hypothetical protein [Alteribacter aurantiacus]
MSGKQFPPYSFFYLYEELGMTFYKKIGTSYMVLFYSFVISFLMFVHPSFQIQTQTFFGILGIWTMSLFVGYKQSAKAFKTFKHELEENKEQRKRTMIEEIYSTDEEVVERWLSMERPTHLKNEKEGARLNQALSVFLVAVAACWFPFYNMVRFLFLRDGKRTAIWAVLGIVFTILPALLLSMIFIPIESTDFLAFISIPLFFFMVAAFRSVGHAFAHREEIVLAFSLILLNNSRDKYINGFDEFYGAHIFKMNPGFGDKMREDI